MSTPRAVERSIGMGNEIAYVSTLFNKLLEQETNPKESKQLASLMRNIPSPSSVEVRKYVACLKKKVENKFRRMVEVRDSQLEEMASYLGENLKELNISNPPTHHYEERVLEMREKLLMQIPLIGKDDSKELCLRLLALKVEIDDFTERTQGTMDFEDGPMYEVD